jgi:hypothetical protein
VAQGVVLGRQNGDLQAFRLDRVRGVFFGVNILSAL